MLHGYFRGGAPCGDLARALVVCTPQHGRACKPPRWVPVTWRHTPELDCSSRWRPVSGLRHHCMLQPLIVRRRSQWARCRDDSCTLPRAALPWRTAHGYPAIDPPPLCRVLGSLSLIALGSAVRKKQNRGKVTKTQLCEQFVIILLVCCICAACAGDGDSAMPLPCLAEAERKSVFMQMPPGRRTWSAYMRAAKYDNCR